MLDGLPLELKQHIVLWVAQSEAELALDARDDNDEPMPTGRPFALHALAGVNREFYKLANPLAWRVRRALLLSSLESVTDTV